ncbi:ABC transporter permease subunit [Deinococcus fonticola]|uniref:ABC transporter permease subunit n=1 Tax=Deinococcus fonticola TaxID=2528713 RepID=UPI001074B2D9|nr:ABC transporter permease subunit [Deinococcus fonticola]
MRWWPALQVLALHFVLLMGLERKVALPERVASYPAQLLGLLRPEVFTQVGPQALLTGAYLLGGLGLAWLLVTLLSRWARPLLWFMEGIPPFLLLALGVWAGVTFTVARGLDFPLTPWSPVMLGLYTASLALPVAARVALATGQVRREALGADYTRTARAMGLPEARIQAQARRVALPERAAGLGGDALGLALALVIMEGLLQFPGLGNSVSLALQGALSGAGDTVSSAADPLAQQTLAAALLLWLLLGVLATLFYQGLAARLDPRPRSGEEAH